MVQFGKKQQEVSEMSAPKRSPVEKTSLKKPTDGRYKDPVDPRIQERKLDEALRKLRGE